MKKKLLGILFVLGLLLALPSMVSFAETKSGTCGATGNEANVTWVLDDNGTLTIGGTGNMKDYDSVSYIFAPWYDARINIQTVVIGSGVTRIGNWAFYQCANLKSVTIPNSVTSIGSYAFRSCTSLTSATIPNSVTSIGGYIFDGCKSLKSVTIPISVTSIEEGSFRDCKSLTSVKIPNSVTSIGGYAFSSCTSLTSVTMPDSVESIGGSTFWYCSNLQSVTIPKKVTSIEESTFEYCRSLTSVKIPNSVTSIGSKAFKHCASLTTMTIPNSVTSIGSDAFSSCTSLTSVTMPDSVESIGGSTFWYCSNLQSVTIPKKVTSIGEHAFVDCTSLTTIYIPMHYDTESKTYKELGVGDAGIPVTATKLYYIAGAAEGNITPVTIDSVTYGNGKEKSITLPCDIMGNGYVIQSAKEGTQATINHNYSEIYTPVTGGNLSAKCKICRVDGTEVGEIKSGPVDPYANLVISETVTVGESGNLLVTTIRGSQQGEDYTTVTVPKDVKYISAGAFSVNRNLDTIYLPEGCQMESESVPLTTKVVYYKVNKDKNENAVVRTASTGEEITQVTVSGVEVLKPDQELNLNNIYGKYEITAIDNDAFNKSGKNLHTIILPNSVESINAGVFENCKNLETIYLKEGCTIENEGNIADKNLIYYTDDGATISSAKINIDNFQLELSQIRNGIGLKIGENAFKDQVKMKSVAIPATVTSIGTNPFAGCTGLQTITVEEGNTAYKIENGVLLSKDGKTLVCYPAGNTGTTCTTPESVTAIAAQAFADCKKLENVVLRENVTSVGADAFTGCDKLKAVYAQKDCDIDSTVLNSENIIYYIVTNEDVSSKEVTIGKTTEDYNDSLAGGQNCIINRAGTELDLNVLNNTGLYKITCIGAGAFYQEASKQHNLKRIIIPEGVTEVKGGFLRYNTGLESVKLPTTLEGTLPRYSITDNKVLKTLTIPHQVTNIDSEAFTATTGLETVYVPSTITDITPITNYSSTANIIYFNIPTTYGSKTSTPIEICIGGNSADSGNKNNLPGSCKINREGSTVDLRMIDGNYKIKEIGTSAFSGWQNGGSAENLKEIVIPEGVTDIAKEAFRFCGKLTSITLPTTYSNGLHRYFITDNQNLKTLVVPHGVTEINSEAFTKVTGLTRVFLESNLSRTDKFNSSGEAKFIRYTVTDENASPKKVKITGASAKVDVYCDEMGDRYVITGNDSSDVTLKHRGDVEVPAKEATCEDDGKAAYWKCLCGGEKYENTAGKPGEKIENEEDLIIAAGHTSLSEVPAKAATFHACGVKAHYKCDGCGKLFSDGSATTELKDNDVNISEHQGHNFGAYSHDYENQALHADVCALKGTVAATCAICDQTDVKACAEHTKSSHVWEEKITPATCTTEGKAEYTCSLCNEPETKILEIDPNNHTYGEVEYTWSDDYTACTAKRVCNNDANHVETEEATVTSEATQEATCTQAEVTTYTATFNKEVFKKQTKVVTGEIDSNNHDYSIEVEGTAREATCTAKGKEADKKCSRCEAVQTGKEIEIDPNNHTNLEKTEAVAATCTKDGNEVYWYCSGCGKYFADEACTTETNISKLTRPATGHTYGEVEYTWSNDYGTCTAKRVCQNDTGHVETENATKITENIIKAATCEGVGKKTYTASFASFGPSESGVVAIPATGHKCNDTWEHNETQHWKVCETCKENVNAANHTDENSDGMCDVCGYVTTPDTYTVSGTVSIWDNTDSNTTRVRLYSSTTSEADIKSDIQHDITDESYAKTCQYDATVLGPEKVEKTNKYTQSFSFADVKSGNYKLAAWRPAYNISSKHYAYVLRVDSIDISETLANNKIELMLYGDITNIGIIGAAGAITIARYRADDSRSLLFSDKTSEYQKKAMDLNDDGTYSPYESICIARHRANIDSPFNQHI